MIKKLICKLFGHVYVKEVYAAPLMHNPHRWGVIKKVKCARCGECINFLISEPKSRAQLLQEGWFIQSAPIWISRP